MQILGFDDSKSNFPSNQKSDFSCLLSPPFSTSSGQSSSSPALFSSSPMYPFPQVDLVPAGTLLLRRSEGNSEVLYKERYILLQIGTIRGSLVYFGGFVLIVLNYGLFGALAQMAGFILIFRTFLPQLYDYICKTPIIGSYLSTSVVRQKVIGYKTFQTGWQEICKIEFDLYIHCFQKISGKQKV